MNNPYKRSGKSIWQGKIISNGKWKSISLQTDNYDDAVSRLREYEQGKPYNIKIPLNHSISSSINEYVGQLKSGQAHRNIVLVNLRSVSEAAGWISPLSITRDGLQSAINGFSDAGLAQETVKKKCQTAQQFIKWLQKTNRMRMSDASQVEYPKNGITTRSRRAMTGSELVAFFSSIPAIFRLVYALAYLCGLKRNEIRELKVKDCQLIDGVWCIITPLRKGEMAYAPINRTIPIHESIVGQLRLWKRENRHPEERLVRVPPDMKTMEKHLALAGIQQVDAQGRRIDFESFRHTFATNLELSGASHSVKKDLLRHNNREGGEPLTHIWVRELKASIDKLPAGSFAA